LLSQPLNLASLTLYLGLIGVRLPLLIRLLDLLTLKLITDQRAGPQAQRSSDGRAGARMTHCGSNQSAGSSAAERSNTRALLAGRQAPARAAEGCA
jgi:hypothetical protein